MIRVLQGDEAMQLAEWHLSPGLSASKLGLYAGVPKNPPGCLRF